MRTNRRMRRRTVPRRTTVRRQAFGNFASAMQQRDSTNVVLNAQESLTMKVPANCNEATLVRNINAIMTKCPMFLNYATMYDQFKLNAVRVAIEMTYISNQLLNSATFPSICTSWDRNGIRPKVVDVPAGQGVAPVQGFLLPIYDTVSSYSSANEKTLYYGSRWSVVRQLDASSMMEKAIYVGTINTKDILTVDNLYGAWNPALLISLKCPRPVSNESDCIFQVHYQFDVTLRGLRKIALDQANLVNIQPNPRFMGFAPNNEGYAIPLANQQAGQAVVYTVASVTGQNGVGNTVAYPTINPNMVTTPAGDVNGGIYIGQSGKADSITKL